MPRLTRGWVQGLPLHNREVVCKMLRDTSQPSATFLFLAGPTEASVADSQELKFDEETVLRRDYGGRASLGCP